MKDDSIIAYLKNELTGEESLKVRNWISASKENERYFNRIKYIWEHASAAYDLNDIREEQAWERIRSSITTGRRQGRTVIPSALHSLSRIAAIVIALIGIGLLLIWMTGRDRNAGTEWLSAGSCDSVTAISLPDGSLIWLNRGAEISYPVKFRGGSRQVSLSGEAYFDIEKNRFKPFIVHAGPSEIRVLGTSFTVRAIDEASGVTVTVVSGRVSLCDSASRDNSIILVPGEKGIYLPSGGRLEKRDNDDINFLAWKTGILTFRDAPLDEVCETLTSHFGRSFILDTSETLAERHLTVTFDNRDLEEVLSILEITLDIRISTKNDTISLSAD